MSQQQPVYGVVAFDISDDGEREKVWAELRGRVMRATKSVMIFDFTFVEDVRLTVYRHAKGSRDKIFPPKRFDDAEEIKDWVRTAMQTLYDDVVENYKRTVMKAEDELNAGKLGVLDLMDRSDEALARWSKRIEDFFLAAVTFRMGGEFEEFKKTIDAALDVEQQYLALVVGRNADKLAKEAKAAADEAKSAA